MENKWNRIKLKDAIQFNPRETIKKGNIAKKVAMEKLEPFNRKISGYEEVAFTSGTKFRNGDTLLARITPCLENGKTAQVDILDKDEIGFGSTEYIVLREKLGITDNDFIYYLAISPEFRNIAIKSMNGSSGRQRVQKDILENSEIYLPDLKEQKAIAKILSDLDEKIEINNKINDNLEKIAQAIFKQWFVDFEFPNENGEPYKSSGGDMIESELGEIPKGWEVKELQEITSNITRGQTPKYEEYSKIKVLNQKVNKGKVLEKQYFKYLKQDMEISKEKYAYQWDILINSLGQGTLGRVHLYKEKTNDVVIDQHITIIRTGYKGLAFYLYNLLDSSKYKGVLEGLISGSTGMLMLNISKIRELKVIKPSEKILSNFESILINLYKNISNNIIQNERLINTRDALLPKLMSGEIRVPLD